MADWRGGNTPVHLCNDRSVVRNPFHPGLLVESGFGSDEAEAKGPAGGGVGVVETGRPCPCVGGESKLGVDKGA